LIEAPDARVPRWFAAGLAGALTFVGTAGFAGTALLVVHAYHPAFVWMIAGTLSALVVGVVARSPENNRTPAHAPALAAVAIAVAFFAITAAFHSEHLLVDRDPGAYANIGRSLASHHTLTPQVREGPFESTEFTVSSPGFSEASGKQRPQFLPMLPLLLALAWAVGGYTAFFLVGPFLGALGLLACYAFSTRLVGPRWAIAVPVLLAMNPLQSWFARDFYSELVVQALVFGAIWLYFYGRDPRRLGLAALAGGLVGGTVLARLDVVAIVAALVLFAASEWVRSADGERSSAKRYVATFTFAMIVMTLYCGIMTHETSRLYLDDQHGRIRSLLLLGLASLVLGAGWVVAHKVRPCLSRRLVRARLPFVIACVALVLASAWAYVLRPADRADAFPLHDIFTQLPHRSSWLHAQWSWSMRWLVDWFGFAAIALALVGFLLLLRRAARGSAAASVFVLVIGTAAAMFITRPDVAPDQPWAMRRFLPIVVPGIVIAVAVAICTLAAVARGTGSSRGQLWKVMAIGAAVAAIVIPSILASAPLVEARAQHGASGAVKKLCNALPSNAAVLLYPPSFADSEMMQTIRGFCGVPTAGAPTQQLLDLAALARAWRHAGRSLYVITTSPHQVEQSSGRAARVVSAFAIDDRYAPRLTYRVRPTALVSRPRQFWLLEVSELGS
jgi:hypothetical protein